MTTSLSDDEIRRRVDLCASTIRKISERHRDRYPAPQLVVSEASLSQRARYDRRANTVRVGGPNVIASPNYSDDALVGLTAHEMGHWFHVHTFRFRRLDWIAAACAMAAVLAVPAAAVFLYWAATPLSVLAVAVFTVCLAAIGPLSWPEEFAADAFALVETGAPCGRAHLEALNGPLTWISTTHPSKRRRVAAINSTPGVRNGTS
ncbi:MULTISPECIES: M48 family metalloprotease [Nocardiaceae]|uniref:M48 family metalloprotease n=1 Tax=Nocardiaceae TaxID=85025 RepID=UPI000651FED7|nr:MULTISPECIES: M48 family metalloprotease [Rhodococcus]KMJ47417.1 hypothetical protein ACG96_23150 [Rhodococcus fascians]MBX5333409.1 M48 family metalloprotease [Rhodococcus fascians]MBY3989298.1 M48 family metalloprotease [Rhodococcus fascians]MBY3999041.1 M48 family metalloprotease [Rhodococcus fascians]MBY4004845.1 M48 family metalloprotease [Rhodococcus fascians]